MRDKHSSNVWKQAKFVPLVVEYLIWSPAGESFDVGKLYSLKSRRINIAHGMLMSLYEQKKDNLIVAVLKKSSPPAFNEVLLIMRRPLSYAGSL